MKTPPIFIQFRFDFPCQIHAPTDYRIAFPILYVNLNSTSHKCSQTNYYFFLIKVSIG